MSKEYDVQTKATALAAVATGESLNSVARRTGIPKTTLIRWRDAAGLPKADQTGLEKKQELGEQLFGYVQESITTLEFLVKFSRNQAWLEKQSADQVAVLFGVLADKTVRVLGALQPNSDSGVDQ